MCGIFGFLLNERVGNGEYILNDCIKLLDHRGPDSNGIWFDGEKGIGLAHSRLSILELSEAGSQPMKSFTGRYIITFNGEIYNHKEIRILIQKKESNYHFQGNSDTETILSAIEIYGLEESLKLFKGMFAFAIWDKKYNNLTLCRDRLGEKPLYYGWIGNNFCFSSEINSLKNFPGFKKLLNKDSIDSFFRFGFIPSPNSIYTGIKKLEPGKICKLEIGSRTEIIKNYWSLDKVIQKAKMSPFKGSFHEALDLFNAKFDNSVKSQLLSDVPVGVFLSGGIDSSAITASMRKQSDNEIRTFSVGFEDSSFDESLYATKIAKFLGTNHTNILLSEKECINLIPKLGSIYDEPFSDPSQIPTSLLSSFVSKKVKVALSGDGGDELFCGYNRYKSYESIKFISNLLPNKLKNIISRFDPDFLYSFFNKVPFFTNSFFQGISKQNSLTKIKKFYSAIKMRGPFEYYEILLATGFDNRIFKNPQNYKNLQSIINYYNEFTKWDDIETMMAMDLSAYLPDNILFKVDRACMFYSLENRSPFLDHELISFIWSLPLTYKLNGNNTKYLLKESLYRNIPKQMFERPKMGFSIPFEKWLKGPLKEMVFNLTSPQIIEKQGIFNVSQVENIKNNHYKFLKDQSSVLWKLLNFQNWMSHNY